MLRYVVSVWCVYRATCVPMHVSRARRQVEKRLLAGVRAVTEEEEEEEEPGSEEAGQTHKHSDRQAGSELSAAQGRP